MEAFNQVSPCMQRKDYYLIGILWLSALIIFLPLFYSDYIFMDEAFQLWGYRAVPGFYMFIDEGRWITEKLQGWLFSMTDTIHQVMWVRVFSLAGWLLCLPVWYAIIKREVANVPHYKYLPFFTCLYLITSLPFLVAVQWATCCQFFISDTASFLAGAIALNSIRGGDNERRLVVKAIIVPTLLGVASLFLYQGSWACFLIPFLLHFVNPNNIKKDKVLIGGVLVYLFVNAAYFVIYKISFIFFDFLPDPRNALYINPMEKITFFLARPLERSFRFTLLTDEDSQISKIYYLLTLLSLPVVVFLRFGKAKLFQAFKYGVVVLMIWLLTYLPDLLIKERYASNRTMFALNLSVFIVCFEMALYFIKNRLFLQVAGVAMGLFFIFCARYNFYQEFARPLVAETAALKNYFHKHYNKNIQTVHWIRPPQDELAKQFNIHVSMDEFGMANSFFTWVPEPLSKQLIYEETGDMPLASKIVVKHWANKEDYLRSGEKTDSTVLFIDTKEIIDALKH